MVLVVGTTGSGAFTTLASMIAHRNRHQTGRADGCGDLALGEDRGMLR